MKLSRLERGESRPSARERWILAEYLPKVSKGLQRGCARPEEFYRTLRRRGRELGNVSKLYLPPSDRPSRLRFLAGRRDYQLECQQLFEALCLNEEYEELSVFCDLLSLGSKLECLFVMALLVVGARPAFREPDMLLRTPNPIVCPKSREQVGLCAFPCLVSGSTAWFPQVSFLTPRLYTVDFLVYSEGLWRVIEIDGSGHRSQGDSQRSEALRLPVQRMSEQQVLQFVRDSLNGANAA